MSDFAINLINTLSPSAANRDEAARAALKEFDANGDGTVSMQEFQKVFAVMQREEQLSGKQGTGAASSFHTAGVRPTIFACTLYPSFSKNYALSQYQATEMLTAFDKNGDHQVTLDELKGVTPPPTAPTDPGTGTGASTGATDTTTPTGATGSGGVTDPTTTPPPPPPDTPQPTPAERADALMAAYDTTKKGSVTLSDIASAWINDPTLGDISQLANTVQAWDASGDGQITRDELVLGFTVMDAADGLLVQLAQPPATANDPVAIQLSSLKDADLQPLGVTRDMLTAWDTNKDGAVTREELVSGLRALSLQPPAPTADEVAQTLLKNYDVNGDNALTFDEFQKALAGSSMDASASQSSFDSWDLNNDGSISAAELTSGVDTAQKATDLVASYDLGKKGYFDIADLQAAIDASPDNATSAPAADILAAWDANGDGKVTAQDIINVLQLQKLTTPAAT